MPPGDINRCTAGGTNPRNDGIASQPNRELLTVARPPATATVVKQFELSCLKLRFHESLMVDVDYYSNNFYVGRALAETNASTSRCHY